MIDCGSLPGEYVNPANKKRIRFISRESLPSPPTEIVDTAEKMRAECASLGKGWQTLEIEHFNEWQFINYLAYCSLMRTKILRKIMKLL